MSKNDIARPKVILDGKQAEDELDKLTQKANKYRDAMIAAASVGDSKHEKEMAKNLKQTTTEIGNLKRESFSVEKVLKNINGASFNEISQATRKATADLKKMKQTDPGYGDQKKAVSELKAKLRELNKESGTSISSWEKFKNTASGLLPGLGLAALAGGVKIAFDNIIGSTDVLGTKWAVFTGGLKSGLNEFWRTLATGEWSNFLDNMRTAISVGREYETTLDNIEEKTRALRIKEAEARKTELDLEIKLKNQTLTNAERLAAGQQRIQLEEDLSKERVKVAQDGFDAELKVTMQQTRLSKERLMEVVSDMDSETKIKAQAYNEQLSIYESAQIKEQQAKAGLSRAGISINPYSEEVAKSKAILDSYPDTVKVYGEAIRGIGKTTDEQLDKMVSSYEGLLNAQNSSVENVKKVRNQVNTILAGEELGTGGNAAEKALKKKQEDAKKISEKLSEFLMKDAVAQQDAINKYFHDAGEGAFDAFMAAIEAKQKDNSIDLSVLPETKPEEEQKDPSLDYAAQKFQETIDYQLLLNETLHENGLRGEQEYQDELTRLTKEGEEKRLKTKSDSFQQAQQLAQFGASFVFAMMDLELTKAGENEEKKKEIRKKYAKIQFLVTASQIVVDTASAIMKALAELGPIAGAIAAGIIGATGAVQLATAYAQMGAIEGYESGGFTKGEGLYKAGEKGKKEWIAPNWMVTDPATAPLIYNLDKIRETGKPIDITNLSKQNGMISTANMASINKAVNSMYFGFNTRSYAVTTDSQSKSKQDITIQQLYDPELKRILEDNSAAIREFMKWEPKVATELVKKDLDALHKITQNTGL